MLTCVRWYVAYPLSLRHIEEMRQERGVLVDHTTVYRWSIKIVPVLANVFLRCKRSIGSRWRFDETYIKLAGQWKFKKGQLCRPERPVSSAPSQFYSLAF